MTAQNETRPNILWLMTDQQPASAMSCAGNGDLRTPAMDELSERGVRFDRAYCVNPICVPSRTSMMTGCTSTRTGVTHNMDRFTVLEESVGARLRGAGYATAYFGKWHIPMSPSDEAWHGFDVMKPGTRAYNDHHFAADVGAWLHRDHERPFFLVASFVDPHDICEFARSVSGFPPECSEPWNGALPPLPPPEECPELPVNFAIPPDKPEIIRTHQSWVRSEYPSRGWGEGRWLQYRWALNRLTELVDERIGAILSALDTSGRAENTIVVFTSDHGDGYGEHRWNQKTLLYDASARVPLIVCGQAARAALRYDE